MFSDFEDIQEFATYLMLEIVFSFIAVFLFIGSVLLFYSGYNFLGTLALILGLISAVFVIGIIKESLNGK